MFLSYLFAVPRKSIHHQLIAAIWSSLHARSILGEAEMFLTVVKINQSGYVVFLVVIAAHPFSNEARYLVVDSLDWIRVAA